MAIIPRHSTTAGLLPDLDVLRVGEIALNITDRQMWSTDGSSLIQLNGATRLSQLDDVADSVGSLTSSSDGSILQYSHAQSQFLPTHAVRLGAGAAISIDGIALGTNSIAGEKAVAIGVGSQSSENSVAVGLDAKAGLGSIVIGSSDIQLRINNIVLGDGVTSAAADSILIGNTSAGSGAGAIAVGNSSDAAANAVAVGNNASAVGISIGGNSSTSQSSSAAIGIGAISTAANNIQLLAGTNATAGTLQFRSVTIANSTSVQILVVANQLALTSMSPIPADGTLAIALANQTMYMVIGGAWIVAATAAFDPSTISFGVLSNVRAAGTGGVDAVGASEDGYVVTYNHSATEWVASDRINGGTY